MEKKDVLRKKHDRRYREQHREEINKRKRETWQRQQNVQHIATASNVYNVDGIQQINESISDYQSSANCSNLRSILPKLHNEVSRKQ